MFDRQQLVKMAKVLTTAGREHIAEKNFALSGERYPIHDIAHARNALARVAQSGTPAEQAKVRAAVARKYPSLANKEKNAAKMGAPGRMLDHGTVKSDSNEGEMMKSVLATIARDATELHNMLEDGDDVPAWALTKVAQAQQQVSGVRDWLQNEIASKGK